MAFMWILNWIGLAGIALFIAGSFFNHDLCAIGYFCMWIAVSVRWMKDLLKGRTVKQFLTVQWKGKAMEGNKESLTMGEYQSFVEGLASEASTKDFQCRIATIGLGLGGEGGEVADYIKKVLFHGKEFSREELIKELGDIQWYVAFACNTLNISMQEVIDKNVDKLKDRYPQGKFTKEDFLRKEKEG